MPNYVSVMCILCCSLKGVKEFPKLKFAGGRLCPQCSNPAPGMGPRSR